MDEKEAVKLLKKGHLEEIAKGLNAYLKEKRENQTISIRNITLDEEGNLNYSNIGKKGDYLGDFKMLVEYLAKELAELRAEQQLKIPSNKKD